MWPATYKESGPQDLTRLWSYGRVAGSPGPGRCSQEFWVPLFPRLGVGAGVGWGWGCGVGLGLWCGVWVWFGVVFGLGLVAVPVSDLFKILFDMLIFSIFRCSNFLFSNFAFKNFVFNFVYDFWYVPLRLCTLHSFNFPTVFSDNCFQNLVKNPVGVNLFLKTCF